MYKLLVDFKNLHIAEMAFILCINQPSPNTVWALTYSYIVDFGLSVGNVAHNVISNDNIENKASLIIQ